MKRPTPMPEEPQKCVPRHSLSTVGLGVPGQEREDKDTQDGINRLRDLIKLRSCP